MNRGFTIIEVLISVLLISISATAILNTFSNNTSIIDRLNKKQNSIEIATIPSINYKNDTNLESSDVEKETNIYDVLNNKYDIDNDNIINELKNTDITIIESLMNKIDLSESNSTENSDYKDEYTMPIFNIKKMIIKNSIDGHIIYKVEMEKR